MSKSDLGIRAVLSPHMDTHGDHKSEPSIEDMVIHIVSEYTKLRKIIQGGIVLMESLKAESFEHYDWRFEWIKQARIAINEKDDMS